MNNDSKMNSVLHEKGILPVKEREQSPKDKPKRKD